MRRILSLGGRQGVFRWYFDHGLSIGEIKRKLDGDRADGSAIEGEPFISRRTLQRLVQQFQRTGDYAISARKRRIDALSPGLSLWGETRRPQPRAESLG